MACDVPNVDEGVPVAAPKPEPDPKPEEFPFPKALEL